MTYPDQKRIASVFRVGELVDPGPWQAEPLGSDDDPVEVVRAGQTDIVVVLYMQVNVDRLVLGRDGDG